MTRVRGFFFCFFNTIGSNFAIWLASAFFDRSADNASRVNVSTSTLDNAWNGCFHIEIIWLTRNMQTKKRQGALLIACCLSWAVESKWHVDPWTKWKKYQTALFLSQKITELFLLIFCNVCEKSAYNRSLICDYLHLYLSLILYLESLKPASEFIFGHNSAGPGQMNKMEAYGKIKW